MRHFWDTLVEQGLDPENVAFLEALGTLNDTHPVKFIVPLIEGFVEWVSQEEEEGAEETAKKYH